MKNYKKIQQKFKTALMVAASLVILSVAVSCDDDESESIAIPVITNISATEGEPGDVVTITGTDLSEASSVLFNAGVATIDTNTETEITVTIPEDATTGKITVTTDGGVAVSSDDFTIIIIGAVVVESVSPISAKAGENVTITGVDMATVSSVTIGEVEATIVSTDATTTVAMVAEGSVLGSTTFTIVNEGGTTTTSAESNPFYVIKKLDAIGDYSFFGTFESLTDSVTAWGGGGFDPEESTEHSNSTEVTDITNLPVAIDGGFFHMEGFSTVDISGSYMTQRFTGSQESGYFADFFEGALTQDIYFNVQINFGTIPTDYEGVLCDFRIRDRGTNATTGKSDDFELHVTAAYLTEKGYTADENGWWTVSIPFSEFNSGSLLITEWANADIQRFGIANRRDYGTGGTKGVTVTAEDGGILATTSFDNAIITIGGPASN